MSGLEEDRPSKRRRVIRLEESETESEEEAIANINKLDLQPTKHNGTFQSPAQEQENPETESKEELNINIPRSKQDIQTAKRPIATQQSENHEDSETESETEDVTVDTAAATPIPSLGRPVTPPAAFRPKGPTSSEEVGQMSSSDNGSAKPSSRVIPSPFQLTYIRDMSAPSNIDTIGLLDILGDPLIKECWQFNYLFNIDFLMKAFDSDVRDLVQVKVVHGSWKKEDPHRLSLEEAASRYPNVQLISAYMPEAFGTHHSKMMILLRHDETAQVIIHTANMIPQDWTNMTQAVFRTPLLPLLPEQPSSPPAESPLPIGSGQRFKLDLLNYLTGYQGKTRPLRDQLKKYDFSAIRAVLVASIPSRRNQNSREPNSTRWGWLGLKDVLKCVPLGSTGLSNVIVQISSVATLSTDWINSFFRLLDVSSSTLPSVKKSPRINVVFPTADEIRRSLDGYQSGGSIHMKIQSAAQQKQLMHMKPFLCHWASDAMSTPSTNPKPTPPDSQSINIPQREALRRRAAPHIKTYIRFSSEAQDRIDWALLTSANLSQQAWGSLPNKSGEVRVCSYEIGVLVWPALFAEDRNEDVKMVPVYGKDMPDETDDGGGAVVGIRMPYDLPLKRYGKDDVPWCATAEHLEPDWKGVVWRGYTPKS